MVKQIIFTLSLFALLVGCSPALQDAASAGVNEVAGDQAQLEPRSQSLIFFPLGEVTDVLIDVQGDKLKALDIADNCLGDTTQIQCAIGVLSEPVTVELTGYGLSAVVSYRRGGVWHLEVLTVPTAMLYPRLTYPKEANRS